LLARLLFHIYPKRHRTNSVLTIQNEKSDINILMLAVCYLRVAIPLLWKLIPKRENSNEMNGNVENFTAVRFNGTAA
jgi:hypothetical protein